MARTNKDPAAERRRRNSEILFGDKLRMVNMCELSRETGIPQTTLYRWRTNTDAIPLRSLILLVNTLKLPDEKRAQLLK